MPLYEYKCTCCDHAAEEFQKMSSDPLTVCPACFQPTYRKQVSLPHTDLLEFHTPIEMFSVALDSPEEVRAFKRACPDVEMSDNFADEMFGVPVARNRKQKLAALRHTGFQERN